MWLDLSEQLIVPHNFKLQVTLMGDYRGMSSYWNEYGTHIVICKRKILTHVICISLFFSFSIPTEFPQILCRDDEAQVQMESNAWGVSTHHCCYTSYICAAEDIWWVLGCNQGTLNRELCLCCCLGICDMIKGNESDVSDTDFEI